MNLTEKQKVLIEKLGVFNERSGMTPVEGRILALLIVSDVVELTFDEIKELLEIGKSTTSNALNMLQIKGRIEYITKLGDRKRYFRVKILNWEKQIEQRMMAMLAMSDLMKEVLANRSDKTPEFNKELTKLNQFFDFMREEFSESFFKWKNRK